MPKRSPQFAVCTHADACMLTRTHHARVQPHSHTCTATLCDRRPCSRPRLCIEGVISRPLRWCRLPNQPAACPPWSLHPASLCGCAPQPQGVQATAPQACAAQRSKGTVPKPLLRLQPGLPVHQPLPMLRHGGAQMRQSVHILQQDLPGMRRHAARMIGSWRCAAARAACPRQHWLCCLRPCCSLGCPA